MPKSRANKSSVESNTALIIKIVKVTTRGTGCSFIGLESEKTKGCNRARFGENISLQ